MLPLPFPALHHHNIVLIATFPFLMEKCPHSTFFWLVWSASCRLLQTSASASLTFLCFCAFLYLPNIHILSVYEVPPQTSADINVFAVSLRRQRRLWLQTYFPWFKMHIVTESFGKLSMYRWTCIFKQSPVSIADLIEDPKELQQQKGDAIPTCLWHSVRMRLGFCPAEPKNWKWPNGVGNS